MTEPRLSNVLGASASPYLQQHKDNPVHWQVWGESALNEAARSGKPILLSIGYAACHWCHVMAHESFEDPETAAVMNELFINIKVDREERSDIDQIYMAALHAMGEQGGWPLTMFLNSDGEPFWGGTYFPNVSRYGRPDFISVMRSIAHIYAAEPSKVTKNAAAVRSHLDRTLADVGTPSGPPTDIISRQAKGILSIVDRKNGGIGQAPKFPNASMLETLWRHWCMSGSSDAHGAALQWLRAMVNGGIYDHLGGGLARYTVDAGWLVPHFEKMLYDNAQLIRSLTWAHGKTGNDLFRVRIDETITWLVREMHLPEGGFASSLDADSEGEEGRFYVWSKAEIEQLLGCDADDFCKHYDVSEAGNWEGKNILNRLNHPPGADADHEKRLADGRRRLLNARAMRIRPDRDDKVLADWNGLMIRALAEAGQHFERPDWTNLAVNAFDFIVGSMSNKGRLAHAWCNDVTTYPALSSDYGTMMGAALTLFQVSGDSRYLERAEQWLSVLDHHYDDGAGSYFYTANDSADVLLRTRHEHDDASPSANASILESLARLALLNDDAALSGQATTMASALWGRVKDMPMAASGAVNAIATVQVPKKLVLVNPAKDFIEVIRSAPDPSRIDLIVGDLETAHGMIGSIPPATNHDSGKQKGAMAFLCHGPVCLPPIDDAQELKSALNGR
ncbi:MAG: thioredoxin domain-containing protein [Alphaproteobacteria bacterium]|nr:thioredoxin domain-containing protein [Alphaproteobacteria bacterium]